MRSILSAAIACAFCATIANAEEALVNGKPATTRKTGPAVKDVVKALASEPSAAAAPVNKQLADERSAGCRYWGSVEYLLWWTKGQFAPPLVTTSIAGT